MEIDVVNGSETDDKRSAKELLRNDMLEYLCKNTDAHFKSQQRGEPDLLYDEKRIIAETMLDKNYATFLSRFGSYLLEDHLDYFMDCSESDRYEVDFYLKRIRATQNKSISRVKVRNRRFEALKKLVSEGSYFSEYEMKKRNPLLYEQLVGKFLTEEEEKERTGVDTANITFVNLLLEQYDRNEMKKLKKRQKEDENNQRDKDDESEKMDEMNVDDTSQTSDAMQGDGNSEFDEGPIIKTLWGEEMTDKSHLADFPTLTKESKAHDFTAKNCNNENEYEEEQEEEEESVSDDEKNLFMEEFRSSMFNSFLEGNDSDFDYNEVDKNSDYDDIDMRDLDEQDQYFESETPEDSHSNENSNQGHCGVAPIAVIDSTNPSTNDGTSVSPSNDAVEEPNVVSDGLDTYIEKLKDIENTEKITKKMESLHH